MVLLLHWMEVRLIVSSAEDWRRTMTTELTRKKVVFRGVGVACNRGGGCSFCLYIYDSDVRCFYEKRQQCVWCGRLRSVDAKHPYSRLALVVVFFLQPNVRWQFFVNFCAKNPHWSIKRKQHLAQDGSVYHRRIRLCVYVQHGSYIGSMRTASDS